MEGAVMFTKLIDRRTTLRLGLLSVAALPLVSRFAYAADGGAGDAASPLQAFNAAVLGVMKASQRVPFSQRFAMLAPTVDRTFDLDAILRLSVGPHWATMTPDQQAKLLSTFRQYTVASFVANFDNYSNQTIEVTPGSRSLGNGDQVVTTRIAAPGGTPIMLAYVMRQTPSGWKAVDVLADGSISRVATQRSDFRSVLSSGGGAALVARLQSKVATLSGGALA
jgi:phospholipid transport system substrate-binding protein